MPGFEGGELSEGLGELGESGGRTGRAALLFLGELSEDSDGSENLEGAGAVRQLSGVADVPWNVPTMRGRKD